MERVAGRSSKGGTMLGVLIGDGDGRARGYGGGAFEQAGHHVLEASGRRVRDRSPARATRSTSCSATSRSRACDGLTVFRHVRRESPGTAVDRHERVADGRRTRSRS